MMRKGWRHSPIMPRTSEARPGPLDDRHATCLFPRALCSTRFFSVTRRRVQSAVLAKAEPQRASRAHSSIGQSSRLITGLVLVRIQVGPQVRLAREGVLAREEGAHG